MHVSSLVSQYCSSMKSEPSTLIAVNGDMQRAANQIQSCIICKWPKWYSKAIQYKSIKTLAYGAVTIRWAVVKLTLLQLLSSSWPFIFLTIHFSSTVLPPSLTVPSTLFPPPVFPLYFRVWVTHGPAGCSVRAKRPRALAGESVLAVHRRVSAASETSSDCLAAATSTTKGSVQVFELRHFVSTRN